MDKCFFCEKESSVGAFRDASTNQIYTTCEQCKKIITMPEAKRLVLAFNAGCLLLPLSILGIVTLLFVNFSWGGISFVIFLALTFVAFKIDHFYRGKMEFAIDKYLNTLGSKDIAKTRWRLLATYAEPKNIMKTEEEVVIATIRNPWGKNWAKEPWKFFRPIIALISVAGMLIIFGISEIISMLAGILTYVIIRARGVAPCQKLCQQDFLHLKSKGYSDKKAMFIVSKSFCPRLSEKFHDLVVSKFPPEETIFFYIYGALSSNTTNEELAIEYLKKTTVKVSDSGQVKVKTNWQDNHNVA